MSKVYQLNIEMDDISAIKNNYYDVIYFGDVIEHLVDPVAALKRIKPKLADGGSCSIFDTEYGAHVSKADAFRRTF